MLVCCRCKQKLRSCSIEIFSPTFISSIYRNQTLHALEFIRTIHLKTFLFPPDSSVSFINKRVFSPKQEKKNTLAKKQRSSTIILKRQCQSDRMWSLMNFCTSDWMFVYAFNDVIESQHARQQDKQQLITIII